MAANAAGEAPPTERAGAVAKLMEKIGDDRRKLLHREVGGAVDLAYFSSPHSDWVWRAMRGELQAACEIFTILEGIRAKRYQLVGVDYVPAATYGEGVVHVWGKLNPS